MHTRIASAAVGALVAVSLSGLTSAPANASCVAASPPRSVHAFTGEVVATSSAGRVATVRTAGGATVQVRGTEAGENQATSVDRTYRLGGRYEFHPINSSPPWVDNACTATHLLAMAPLPQGRAGAVPDSRHAEGALAATTLIAAALAAVAATVAMVWRRRRQLPLPG